jgi:hypothetical protein
VQGDGERGEGRDADLEEPERPGAPADVEARAMAASTPAGTSAETPRAIL